MDALRKVIVAMGLGMILAAAGMVQAGPEEGKAVGRPDKDHPQGKEYGYEKNADKCKKNKKDKQKDKQDCKDDSDAMSVVKVYSEDDFKVYVDETVDKNSEQESEEERIRARNQRIADRRRAENQAQLEADHDAEPAEQRIEAERETARKEMADDDGK